MTQQKTNTGYKGYYSTEIKNLKDMKATEEDMERYNEQNEY